MKNTNKGIAKALRGKGWTYQRIAEELGVTRQRVFQYINGNPKYSPTNRHNTYIKKLEREIEKLEVRERIMSLRRRGVSYKEISRQIGISQPAVMDVVFDHGFIDSKSKVCERCGASGVRLQRHHETYSGSKDKIKRLCSSCHNLHHQNNEEIFKLLGMYLIGVAQWKDISPTLMKKIKASQRRTMASAARTLALNLEVDEHIKGE